MITEKLEVSYPHHHSPDPLIENWFTYHAPNADQQRRYQELRAAAKSLAYTIQACSRPGPDQSAAFRLLRECVMTANAAIALEPAAETLVEHSGKR